MSKKVKRPNTKQECFDMLDEMPSQEDKNAIVEMEDANDLHFGIDMWIRENWIYPRTIKTNLALIRQFVDDADNGMPFFIHPDDYSSVILDAYQEYLKQMRKAN